MSSGGYRERGFGPQGRFEVSPGPTKTGGPRQTGRNFNRGTFNPPRRNDRPQMEVWATSNPQPFYHQNNPQTQHNSSQSWQNRGRFQENLRQPFRGTSNYSPRGSRGSFTRTSGFRFSNGRGNHQNQDYRWRLPNRDFQQPDKPEDPGPPLLGSEEERQQKITDAVDEVKRKFLCNDGPTEDLNLWDDDFNIPGPEPDDEGQPRGIPELRHGPPEITLTTSDLKDIGRVDSDTQKSTDIHDDPDCEIIDVAKSVRTFSEITIHDSGESPMDFNDDNPDLQKNIPGNDDFTNDEYFDKSPKNDNLDKSSIIPPNIEETVEKGSRDNDENSPNAEKSTESNKSNPQDVNPLNISSPIELSHTFAPPQRREPSPDDFIDKNLSKKSKKKPDKKLRGWPVEFAPDPSSSPIGDFKESQKSSKNLNFPQKISVNINRPPETSFTPPLPPSRPQMMGYDVPQPAPAFDPRRQNNDLQMGNLIPDYGIICPGGYPMPQMMNMPSMEYNMTSGYGPMNPYVPLNYPPVIPSLDYPSPMAPPSLNNLNTPVNPLNQIPMPSNPLQNEDDALGEIKEAMQFAAEQMGMGDEADVIKFQKVCENGFDNFPTLPDLPDLPPPLPPLPVPPESEEKSKSKKKKKKKKKRKEDERTSLPPVSEILESAMAAAAAASKSSIPSSSPSTTPPSRNISASIKEGLISSTKEDHQKVTFNLSPKSKKIDQCVEWKNNDISIVPEIKLRSFLPVNQQKTKESSSSSSVSTCQVPEKPEESVKTVEKSEIQSGKVEDHNNSSSLEINPLKKPPQALDLVDLLKSTQFDSLNLFPSHSSTTPRPSHTPDPSDPVPIPSTSKKQQSSTWKDRVIGRFLRMSKNEIKNMINNSNLRKFDIAMQHLVKEKKSSLSLEMRNIEDERIKNRENTYNKEDFIHQLKQILDPAATVDISDLPTNFIHQLNEVLQLDVLPNEDNTNSTTLSNQETQHTPKIDQLYQNHNSSLQMFGINAPGDTFKLSKIDIPVSKDSTKSLVTLSESTVTQRRAKRNKNSISHDNQSDQLSQQLNSPDSSLSSQVSGVPDTGALIMDELDDIFSAGINRGRVINKIPHSVKQSSTFGHNYGNNSVVDRFSKRSMKNDDQRVSRCRKNSSDLDFFRNLTKEEYDARYGESSHSSHDNPYRIMNPKLCRKFSDDQINGDSDQEQPKVHQSPVSRNHSDDSSSSSDDGSDDYDSGSSSGSSDESSDEPSIDVSRMLRFIKEREKIAKKKSLNEEIRDEVTAEIERKRREKRAHREHRARSRKKDRKGKSRRTKHKKCRKKKKRRSHHSGDDNQSFDRSLPLLDVQDIKKEPEDVELPKESSPQVQRKRVIGPKSVMAKAELMQQEQKQELEQENLKSSKIRSPSVPGPKSTLQGSLSVINTTTRSKNRSPIIASPSRNSPAHSSPNSSGSANSQSANQLLKTKAQLKQMPEGIKTDPAGLKLGVDRRGPCTPPLQVRPMTELLKKPGDCGSDDHSDVPGKSAVSPAWGQFYQNSGAFGRCLDSNEGTKSPLRVAQPESARFTFLQRNKLVDGKDMNLSPLIGDNLSCLRVDGDRRSLLEASGNLGGAEGGKGTSTTKKLDFKAYQERALQRRLRAEGKLPPLLEKIDPRIHGADRGSLRTPSDDVASPANSSPPVLVKQIITKNFVPSGEVKVKNQQVIGEKSSEVLEKVSVKVQSPGESRKLDNVRSTSGPLSSKLRKNVTDIGRKEDNVSPSASEINSPSQREDSLQKSKLEGEKSVKKRKRERKGNRFTIYFRRCKRVGVCDGLPDVVPVEGLPETRVQDSNLRYGEISEETGEIANKLVELPEKLDSVEKMAIDDEKLPELHSEKAPETIENDLEASGAPGEPAIPGVSLMNTLGSLKSNINEEKSSIASVIPSEIHKEEEMNSLDLLEAPVTINNRSKLHSDPSDIPSTPAGPSKSPFVSEPLKNCLPTIPGDSPGIPDSPKPPENVDSTLQRLPEDIPSNLPKDPQNSGIENLKEVDLNERNDLASLKADEATWRVDSNHLDDLHNPPNIRNSKEEVSFTESQTNWQLEAEISTEESRKNVVLHDRALVVDTPRNSLLDDPIAFATSNNSPVNDGETTDEFGILCEGSIYDNHLVESSIGGINDSSVPMRTSYTPDNEFIGDMNDDEGLNQIDQVGILDRELLEVGRKGSPVGLPTLILQGMVRDVDDGVKSPGEGVDVPAAAGDVEMDTDGVKTPGGEDNHAKIDGNGAEILQDDDSRVKLCGDDDKSVGKGADTGGIGEECDKTLQEAEEDIKELQEAEGTITTPGGSFKILETSDKAPETCLQAIEPDPEPEMQVLAPEDVENSLNSLATEKSHLTQPIDISSLGFPSKIDAVDTPKALDAPHDEESVPKSSIISEEKPEALNQPENPNLPENNKNKTEIDDSSSSRPSPTSWGPSPTPSAPSSPPETSKTEDKPKLKDVTVENSKKDKDSLRKLNKSSTTNREHKKNKHHDKKKMKISGKMVKEAIESATVVVSKPKTKDEVIKRMQHIDIEMQKLMDEKMELYQLMRNDEWPVPEAEVPEPAPVIEEKSKVKSNSSGDKSIARRIQKVGVPRVPDAPHVSDHSSSISAASEGTNDVIKHHKPSKNEEKRSGNWEDKIPLNKAKKRAHSKEDVSNEGVKSKEARNEGSTDSSRTKTPDVSGTKKDKKPKHHEDITKKPVRLSQLIGRDFKPKPSSQKGKFDDKGRDVRDKSVEKSSIKHKNSHGHVENHEKREDSGINSKIDEKKKKKSMENQGLLYSDDSTLDSVDRSDQRKATGLALLEESMKREVGMKKKENSRKLKDSTPEDEDLDIPKSSASSVKKTPPQKKGRKSIIPESSGGSKGAKHVQESNDPGVKNRGIKKPQKTDKIHNKSTQDVKKKSSEDPGKSQDHKFVKNETKSSKKIDTKLNLIDSDSSDDDFPDPGISSSRSHVKTPSKRLEDSSDDKERNKVSKKQDKIDSKARNLKNEILDDWSDSSSDSSKLQKDKKTSKVSQPIIEDSEDEVKRILSTEKLQKSKITDSKTSKSAEKRSKSVMSDKSKSSSKDSYKKSSSKDSDKSKVSKEVEKSKKDEKEKEKLRVSSRTEEDSPIEGDDEDDDISIKRKGTSKRSKKISRRSNKSTSRSRSRSKRALRSSSRDSSLEVERTKKRQRSESSTSSRNSRRKSIATRTEPHPNEHKRREGFGEKSREEMMDCRVKLVDCKYLLSLRPEEHPQVFKRLGISRINPWTCAKLMEMPDDKDRSEDDYHSMIVVEVDDNVESSSAVELIEEGNDYGEDNISEKSVCLGFPVSPRGEELVKEGVKEGASEGDVEMIEIKEEPIMRADSRTGEGLGDDPEDDPQEVEEENVQGSQVEGENEEEVEDKERMRYTVHKGPILDIKVFGDSFLAASEDGAIYRYSQKSNGILNIYQGHEAAVTCLYVHEIPGITESKKWYLFSGSLDASLRCYDVMGGILNRPKVTVGSPIQCMDEAWGSIFIGTKSGHISRYDIKTGSLREDKLDFSDKPVLALRASTEGPRKILIVASRNQPITIRDAVSGLFLRTIAGQRTHTVYSLMRDRNLVYCGTSCTSIPVFDFISGEQVTQFTAGVGIVCMRLYRQLLFAGCYDGNIYVFDTKEPKLVCSIPGPGNMLLSMEIVDDTIIAGSKDRRLHAWRMPPSVRTIILERT